MLVLYSNAATAKASFILTVIHVFSLILNLLTLDWRNPSESLTLYLAKEDSPLFLETCCHSQLTFFLTHVVQ